MKSIVFEPTEVYVNKRAFRTTDWKDFYGDVEEEDPPDIPEPLGK